VRRDYLELCEVIADYDKGARPGNFAERLRHMLEAQNVAGT
jgi:hypothetical protein